MCETLLRKRVPRDERFRNFCARMNDITHHRQRANELGDSLRKYLLTVHTGGIGAVLLAATSLTGKDVSPDWARLPLTLFVLGAGCVGVSMTLAKYRELRRDTAMREGMPEPEFNQLQHSLFWDLIALTLFLGGAWYAVQSLP
jgi:hypothetical protein